MAHPLTQLALIILAPLFALNFLDSASDYPEKFPIELMGDICIEIIDPNTGFPSSAFTVDTICQGDVMDFCLSTSGCNEDIEIISVSGNLGQVIITPPTSPFDYCFSYTAPADLVGSDTFTLTVTNSENGLVTSTTTVDLTYVVADPGNNTTISPPQDLCSPANSTTIEAINPDPIVGGYWVVLQGGGDPIAPEDIDNPVLDITNLPFGESIYMWRQDYPCQSTFDLTSITVYDGQAPIADAGDDVTFCSFDNSYTMQANDPLFSATGTWEITFGNASINDINDPNAEVSGLGIGCNIFEWNISNGPCPGGETVDQIIICVYDQNAPPAYAGEDIELCDSGAGINTATTDALDIDPFDPATGLWTPISGFGVIEDSDDNVTLIENLQIGINEFVWTVENGSCPDFPSADTLEIRVYDSTHAFPQAGPDASYCAPISEHLLTGSSTISPAVGTWQVITGTGSFSDANDPNASVSNLSIGVNTFRWLVYNGPCNDATFFDDVTVTVFDPNVDEANAGDDVIICEEDFTSFALNASLFSAPASGEWSVEFPEGTLSTDLISDVTNPTADFSGASPGEYVLRWTVNNGPCAAGDNFDELTILIYPTNQVTSDAGDDLDLCTPITSFNLDGNTPLIPGIGTWTLESGSGAIQNPNNPLSAVTNLGVGQNVFRWTIENGDCEDSPNFSEVIITVFNVNTLPANAGPGQEFCFSPGGIVTVDLAANTPDAPAVGEWSIVSGSGTFSSIADPNAQVSNPGVGTNIYEWSIDNGACDVVSNTDQVIIEIFNSVEPAASAGDDIELCSDELNTFLSANTPSDPATGSWSVVQGAGVFTEPTNPNTEVTGFNIGTNTYRWTITNGPCTPPFTFDDVEIIVFNEDVDIANAGEDLEICNNFGPVVLSATSFQSPASGEWTVISGTGNFSNSADPNSTVSGWSVGDNIYEWSVNNGPCSNGTNNDQITIIVFDINADQANAGVDQEICTPLTAADMTASTPSYPSTGYWTVLEGTGLFLDETDPTSQVTGLSVGENRFSWTIDNGACSSIFSLDEVSIFLFDEGVAIALAGPDQNFCEPVNSTTLAGNIPASPSSGIWTLVSGNGDINDPTDPNTLITNLTQGINIFEWTVDAGPCIQDDPSDFVSINIFEDNHPPALAGDDIEVCTPSTSAQLDGSSPISPAVGTWIQVSGPNSASFDPDENDATLTNLIPGTYIFQWQIDIGPCSVQPLTDQVTISVYDSNSPEALVGADISLCTPDNFTVLNGNSAVGAAVGTWTLLSGFGTIEDANDPLSNVTNLTVGINEFIWTIDNGSCGTQTTTDTLSIYLYDNTSPTAFAGEDQSLCSPESTSLLSGNQPIFPATVEWNLVSGTGLITSPTSVDSEVTGLTIGENVFSYTVFNGGCDIPVSTDEISIFVFDGGAPAAFAGDDIEICSNNSTSQMNADPAVDPGVGIWALISGDASVIVDDINDPLTGVSNLQIGTYVFEWSLDYSTCGTQADQIIITVFDIDLEDTDAGEDIVLCLPDNTSVMNGNLVSSPAVGTWNVLQGSATFSNVNDPNASVSNLAVGENILAWSVFNGICTPPEDLTDEVSVFLYEENLPSAFAGIDQELCAENGVAIDVPMTAIAASNPGQGVWTILQGGGDFTDSTDPHTIVTSVPVGVNIYQWSLDYNVCAPPTSDTVIIDVYDSSSPVSNAGPDQSFCSPVPSVILDANSPVLPAVGTWSQIVGTAIFDDVNDPNSEITNLGVGVTILRWSIDNGPCDPSSTNDLVTIFVYDEDAADAGTGEDQELCLPNSSSSLQGNLPVFPGVGTWSQIQGTSTINNNNNPNSPVSNLSPGINRFVWSVFNGPCLNSTTTDTLTISVFDPTSPDADAGVDQNLCSTETTTVLSSSVPITPSTGVWTQVLGIPATISNPSDPNTQVTDLSIGINTFQWSIYNGPCENSISSDVVTINVYDVSQAAASAGEDQDLCLPVNETSFMGNPVTSPAVGQWNLVTGSGQIADINNPTSSVSNLGTGENIFTWTIDNGPCENAFTSETVIINVFDPSSEPAFTIPDFQECSPVETLPISANEALGAAIGSWTQFQGSALIDDDTSNNTVISNLDVGTYIFVWEIDNGSCGSSTDTLTIEIFDPLGLDASAGDNQSYCTPISTAVLEGSELISPATGVWEIVIGNGNIVDPENPLATIENLTVGETILSWTVDNGPCGGVSSDFMSMFIFDETAPDADAGEDQEFCLPESSTFLDASDAIFPAIGNWTVIEGGADITNINSANSEITNLTLGLNTFVWSVDNSPCSNGLTRDTMQVLIYPDEFSIADAGLDQDFCSPVNSTLAQALEPDIPSIGTWNLTSGSGSILEINNPTSEIEQLGIGTNIFSWQVYHGPCDPQLTVDLMTISIYDLNHPPADAGSDQELCMPDNSVVMTAIPTADPVTGEWSVVSGGGLIATLNDPNSSVTEIPVGENIFVWTIDNGPCENPITTDTVVVRIFSDQASLADAGSDFDLCGETNVVLDAVMPDSPSTGSWAVISGPSSGSFDDITDPNAEISGLVIGQYSLQWIVDNGPCVEPISSDQMIINVFDINQIDAFAGDTLRQCMPMNEFQLSASPVSFPSVGTWTNSGGGDISNVNDPNAVLSNTVIGEQILTWSVANGPCGDSQDDLVIQVFDPNNPSADAGPDQSICTDLTGGNEALMSANIPVYPSVGTWSVVFGPSPTISDINDPSATITNIGFGETQLEWLIDNGPCDGGSTQDIITISHFDSNESDANAGVDQSFCDIPFTVNLAANPTIGNTAIGTWTVTSSPIGSPTLVFVDVNEESSPVSGFEIGIYELTWTVDNGECGVTSDIMVISVFDPDLPNANAGMDMEVCEDEFLDIPSINLEGNQFDLPATVNWSILEGNPVINEADVNVYNPEITYLGEIDEPLGNVVNTFLYTVNNGPCGVSTDTVTYTLVDCLTIDVPDAFSPNRDDINDTWFIPNLYKYPNNEIMVFNRWGTKVFEAKDYQGDWTGTSEHPATIGEELPVGTYYYVLDLGDGSAAYKGFVYLKR